MPKLFASEVDITNHETGKTFSTTIKVNTPLIDQDIAVCQSGIEDGGSKLPLTAFPMSGPAVKSFVVAGTIGSSATPADQTGQEPYTIEWTGFRPINVENMGPVQQDTRSVEQQKSCSEQFALGLDQHTGSAAQGTSTKDLHNLGALVQYKLRDKNGQAKEFINYM